MNEGGVIAAFILAGILLVGGCMAGYPQYQVYSSRLEGEAELEKQKYAKKVAVEAALAKKDSAQLLAEAEIIRSEGVAKANKIIGDSLHNNEAYLRYLWINGMTEKDNHTVIYVPTEANLPILEAGKR
jgi:regulator of protease activity HflC (stomatin/prohibitin superfamily)